MKQHMFYNALVAQWKEHLIADQKVAGSTPAGRAKNKTLLYECFVF